MCAYVMKDEGREISRSSSLKRWAVGLSWMDGKFDFTQNDDSSGIYTQQIQFSRVMMRTSVWDEPVSSRWSERPKRDCEDGKGKVSFSSVRAVLRSLNSRGWKGIRIAIEQVLDGWWEFPFMKLVYNTMSRRGRPSLLTFRKLGATAWL